MYICISIVQKIYICIYLANHLLLPILVHMYFVLAFTNTCIYASIIYIFAIIVVVEDCLVHISVQSVCESFPLFFDVHVVVVSDLIFFIGLFSFCLVVKVGMQ